jgi:hypothetical protein
MSKKQQSSQLILKTGAVMLVLVCVAVFLVTLTFLGGINGIGRGFARLPDFNKGEPAANRQNVIDFENLINNSIEASGTTKSYGPAVLDTCQKNLYDWLVHTEELATCKRVQNKLYFSNQSACEVLAKIQPKLELIGVKLTSSIDRPCEPNRGGSFYDYNSDHHYGKVIGSMSVEIQIQPRAAHQQKDNFIFFKPELFNPDEPCNLYNSYCINLSGGSREWESYIAKEQPQTIIYLNTLASRYYFK